MRAQSSKYEHSCERTQKVGIRFQGNHAHCEGTWLLVSQTNSLGRDQGIAKDWWRIWIGGETVETWWVDGIQRVWQVRGSRTHRDYCHSRAQVDNHNRRNQGNMVSNRIYSHCSWHWKRHLQAYWNRLNNQRTWWVIVTDQRYLRITIRKTSTSWSRRTACQVDSHFRHNWAVEALPKTVVVSWEHLRLEWHKKGEK